MGSKGSKPLMTKFTVLAIRLSSGPCSFGSIGITGADSGISPCRGSPFPAVWNNGRGGLPQSKEGGVGIGLLDSRECCTVTALMDC